MRTEFNTNETKEMKVYNEDGIEQTFLREYGFDTWNIKAILFILLALAGTVVWIMS